MAIVYFVFLGIFPVIFFISIVEPLLMALISFSLFLALWWRILSKRQYGLLIKPNSNSSWLYYEGYFRSLGQAGVFDKVQKMELTRSFPKLSSDPIASYATLSEGLVERRKEGYGSDREVNYYLQGTNKRVPDLLGNFLVTRDCAFSESGTTIRADTDSPNIKHYITSDCCGCSPAGLVVLILTGDLFEENSSRSELEPIPDNEDLIEENQNFPYSPA